ncbi:MAG: cytochrome b N-terminal domain-containing protein [Thermoplasmatota archaeon]
MGSSEVESHYPTKPRLPDAPGESGWHRFWGKVEDQFGVAGLVREYMIPVETNTIWYALGGVLAISLVLEVITGVLLALWYVPDAARAYDITVTLLATPVWQAVLNFHYWNSYLIFALVMVHMMRVFVSGGYRRGKQGLWLVGAALAGIVFLLSLTGETLHWDERGFAVPWHIGEFLEAIGLASVFQYSPEDLLNVANATAKLVPLYVLHIAVLPLFLGGSIALHYYLVKIKRVSLPFWQKASGRVAPFTSHVKAWLLWSLVLIGPVILVAAFVVRAPGAAPQLLPSSPYYGPGNEPGEVVVPTFPLSWTHGMARFAGMIGVDPDIWGVAAGMGLMVLALLAVPFVDRGDQEPANTREAFRMKKRWAAFAAIALFWIVFLIGTITNIVSPVG